jgi:hypothetical protein
VKLLERLTSLPPAVRLAAIVAGVALAAWGAYGVGAGRWSAEQADLTHTLGDMDARIASARTRVKRLAEHDAAIQAIADRTLGADKTTVDSELRSRLNRIAEELDLVPAVSTGEITKRESPRRNVFRGAGRAKELREEVDFVEVEATILADGSLDKVLRLLHRVEAEPWIKRTDSVMIDPLKDGESQKIQIKLTTLFLPGRKPSANAAFPAYDPSTFDPYMALVDTNPFRVPPPPKVEAASAQPAPPQPPPAPGGFPWHDWMISGIGSGPQGWEVWLRNQTSGETRRLVFGDMLADARLVGASVQQAEFQIAEQRFAVAVGGRLSDRTPLVR